MKLRVHLCDMVVCEPQVNQLENDVFVGVGGEAQDFAVLLNRHVQVRAPGILGCTVFGSVDFDLFLEGAHVCCEVTRINSVSL